jgi:hypothetical protein
MEKNIFAVLWGKIFPPAGESKASGAQEASGENKTAASVIASKKPSAQINAAEQLYATLAKDAAFVFDFKANENITVPKEMTCQSHAETDSEVAYIMLSGGNPLARSGGKTGGYGIRLPDEIESTASGHHVTLSVIARASGTDQSRFAIGYSTNDVGNSGWQWVTSGKEWSIYKIEYDVPVMKKSAGDFVGILPDGEGQPGTEFCYLAIHID